jgi:hypothetical protein
LQHSDGFPRLRREVWNVQGVVWVVRAPRIVCLCGPARLPPPPPSSYRYTVPTYVPELLCSLARCLHDPHPIPVTVKRVVMEFKRTHHDNWAVHKAAFTEDQLTELAELLVSPHYYA